MGLAKRRLYKPERRPARIKGVLYGMAPIGLPDANAGEVAKALFALAKEAGVKVGRGSGYDSLRDEYTVVGKSAATGLARDYKIDGSTVAQLITFARLLAGGKMDRAH
jgi:hypothetical protein